MIRLFSVLIMVSLIKLDSCTTQEIKAITNTQLEGEWILKNVFLGDAVDTPCGWEAGEHRDITINFTSGKSESNPELKSFNGQSAVNQFFGNYQITTYDNTTQTGTIKTSTLGSTKMAGPPELMQCETRLFDFLTNALDFGFEEIEGKSILKLGNFRKPDSHPRDGGTYLIFEKK